MLYGDVADKSQVGGYNRGNRPEKYRVGNQDDDSDGENSDGRAKASGDANSEHKKIGYFDAENADEEKRGEGKNSAVKRCDLS